MKLREKWAAIKLRKKGWMVTAISKKLGVSKSTLSVWFRNLELTSIQEFKILKGRAKSRFLAGQSKKQRRITLTQQLFEEGRREAFLRADDSFFVSGIMLYWAEGAKTDGTIKFSNSDPTMIRFMTHWFKSVCRVPLKKFRISLHIHNLHSRPNVESYWSKITGIPRNQFYKTQIKESSLGQRRNILYEGTCSICISDIKLFRKMLGWRAGALAKLDVGMKV